MSAMQPGVAQCTTCPNLMRPHRAAATDYPGTASRASKTTCSSCAARKLAATKPTATDKAIVNNASLNAFMTARRNRIANDARMAAARTAARTALGIR